MCCFRIGSDIIGTRTIVYANKGKLRHLKEQDSYENQSDRLFDHSLDRRGTDCVKWDFPRLFSSGNTNSIPVWIAEMDFPAPPAVQEAVMKRAGCPNYGYTWKSDEFLDSVCMWFSRFGWDVCKTWITTAPGVMSAISLAIRTYTSVGDIIVTDAPIYPAIHQCISNLGRKVVFNRLLAKDGQYVREFDDVERVIDGSARMYILCNPHNPSGRVWNKEELFELGQFCTRHDMIIVSDEIFADLCFRRQHTCIAALSSSIADRSVTCISPGKTYCVSGLQIANVVIPNKSLRNNFVRKKEFEQLSLPNVFGPLAVIAAYTHSGDWLKRLKTYLETNIDNTIDRLACLSPRVRMAKPEGTFLLWMDCRNLPLSSQELCDYLLASARIVVSSGRSYGPGGEGFIRMSLGLPRRQMNNMLEDFVRSIDEI